MSLFAVEKREIKPDCQGDLLREIEKHIDFKALAAEIDRTAQRPGRARGGCPLLLTELKVRAFILQNLYGLSERTNGVSGAGPAELPTLPGAAAQQPGAGSDYVLALRERLTAAHAGDSLFRTERAFRG
ncbi:MAG: hypothetical protein PHT19_07380 [Methylococcus sp.]|nr:hypothetical protein [Methylococcus sp.]